MKASIDNIADSFSESDKGDVEMMKLSAEEKQTISDIADKVPLAINLTKHKKALRDVAVNKYDWKSVGQKMIHTIYTAWIHLPFSKY